MGNRRYWSIRTDKDNREILFAELAQGKLRQGWGYDVTQDLVKIQKIVKQGGKWWEQLTDTQNAALPNMRMLSDAEDSIKIGDIILTPNLPEQNFFCLAEVTGDYYFERLKLNEETDVNDFGFDYGHILPIRLLTTAGTAGIDKYNKHVHAEIRSTLRTPMRMWNLDPYSQSIERLLTCFNQGEDLLVPSTGEARLNIAWDNAFSKAIETLQKKLTEQLNANFQAAEWEEPIKTVLSQLYPGANVRWTGGANEHGADIVIQLQNHFGDIPWLIVIQVKNYTGEIGENVLSQIREAHNYYSKEGKIILGVILTTAEKRSSLFDEAKAKLEREISMPIELILRQKLIKIMTEGLARKIT